MTIFTTYLSTGVHSSKLTSQRVTVQQYSTVYNLMHIYVCMFLCLCVYKAALDGHWGRRWPDWCVCLGRVSAFHIPLWYSVLWPQETRPAKKLSLSLCSIYLSFLPPLHFSLFYFCPLIIYSVPFSFFSLWTWKIICQSPPSLLQA